MNAATQTRKDDPNKVYFYYPGYNAEFVRRTFAGVVEGNMLYVGEARLFPGTKARLIPVKLGSGRAVYVVDPGIKSDHFIKAKGREIATKNARGYFLDKNGKKVEVGRYPILSAKLPDGDVTPAKFFVEQVEKYLKLLNAPLRTSKPKKIGGPRP